MAAEAQLPASAAAAAAAISLKASIAVDNTAARARVFYLVDPYSRSESDMKVATFVRGV